MAPIDDLLARSFTIAFVVAGSVGVVLTIVAVTAAWIAVRSSSGSPDERRDGILMVATLGQIMVGLAGRRRSDAHPGVRTAPAPDRTD